MRLLALFDEARGSAGPDLIGRNVAGDNGARAENHAITDRHSLCYPHAAPEPAVLTNNHRLDDRPLIHDQFTTREGVVLIIDLTVRADLSELADPDRLLGRNHRAPPDAHVVFENHFRLGLRELEIGVRIDGAIITDDQLRIVRQTDIDVWHQHKLAADGYSPIKRAPPTPQSCAERAMGNAGLVLEQEALLNH